MRGCSLITGVVRPNAERVFENLEGTIKTLDPYSFNHFALTYRTDASERLVELVKKNNLPLSLYLIDPIVETIGGFKGNNYRMFRSIELLMEEVPNFSDYDVVLRHRIDCELQDIDIPECVESNTYYAPRMSWGLIFDNFGVSDPTTFKKIFHTNQSFDFPDPHAALTHHLEANNIKDEPIDFKKTLYQSEDTHCMGISQWSRENRVFEYNSSWIRIK